MPLTAIDQLRAVFRQPRIVAGTGKAARADADGITVADIADGQGRTSAFN